MIKTFVENVQAILSIPICEIKPGMSDNNLKSAKMTLTALLAQAFDRLLFHDADIGACLHQLPIKANDSVLVTPDLCVIEKQLDNLPGRTILLSTFCYDWCYDEMKSIAYSIRAMEASARNEEFVLQLCLPLSSDSAKLQVHVGQHEKIMNIDVCEIDMRCSSELERFCCVLRGVVHSLIKKPVHTTVPCITPLCDVQLTNYLSDNCRRD